MATAWTTCLLCMAIVRLADTAFVSLLQVSSKSSLSGPEFTAPAIGPQQFLMISSPTEKKVVWTTLKNFESSDGRAFALVDSGLSEPKGLAFDHKKGHLYVADSGARKIFRYTVLADTSGSTPMLSTSGVRLTIVQDHPVEFVTVDEHSNLFYTCSETNNINKIEANVLDQLAQGKFLASALQIISEKSLEAQKVLELAMEKEKESSDDGLPTDPPEVEPHILSIYEAKVNPHVSQPASIWADGADLYWTNQKDGTTAGTVVKGQVLPKSKPSKSGPAPFPAVSLTNISNGAFGLAKSDKAMFFTRSGHSKGTGLVTGLLLGTDITIDFVKSIATPRGLVFDKDQTMYVADEQNGHVWSFPIGRMMTNAPITKAVTMAGAYGLVILSTDDPAFAHNLKDSNGASEQAKDLNDQVTAERAKITQHGQPDFVASFIEVEAPSFLKSYSNREQHLNVILTMLAAMFSMIAM